jgi:hypothetical protein
MEREASGRQMAGGKSEFIRWENYFLHRGMAKYA